MPGDLPPEPAPLADATQPLLGRALRWLAESETAAQPLGGLLADLAAAVGADGAGLARLPDGEPIAGRPEDCPLPWQSHPELIHELAQSVSALRVRDGARHWLLTAVAGEEGAGWLLWLQGPAAREWSAAEAAALALTGEALARRLRHPSGAPRWARQLYRQGRRLRFDEAATAARRIAHDYGNVLTGILGFSELALAQVPRGSAAGGYLVEVRRAAQQGERLTNRLRLLARRGWQLSDPAPLAAVIAEEVRRLRAQFPAVRLEVAVAPDVPAPAIDAEALGHVLAQMLDNAAEATAGRGPVRLSARAVSLGADECLDLLGAAVPGPHVEVVVEDDGCGLSDEARRRLLVEPFFTTKPRQRGYGLAVAYGILAGHQGALAVEPADRGTVARAYLPAAAPAPAPAAASSRPGVLVVDNDPMVLRLIETTLQRAGYRVETVTSAAEALRCYTGTPDRFGLVLSDLAMPQGSGYELARQLCAHDAGVNVLFMSGQGATEAGRPAAAAGDLLTKPFGPDGLLRAVRRALKRGAARDTSGGTGDEAVRSRGT